MKNFKELQRGMFKRGPITLLPGDKLALTFNDEKGTTVLVEHTITECMTADEGVLFEVEFEGRRALGGMALEAKK